ncbi:hypothetical protein CANARDRAFT_173803 [[Candida] arabinofermentans NRRL YB-2248]|uniref:2-dehydropantolactone reductase n=1 Tax=[Candida] arabinofermentans NRRL YB-2248 TaxID=983967 RepID=A0A1E4T839_9ASCO|nr:hypothetical protein CANARDRAFT_173803 [[Candida] arabinofermentans NRRL YB-2248]
MAPVIPTFTLARTGDKIPAIAMGSGTKHQRKKKGDPKIRDAIDEDLVSTLTFALTKGHFNHLDTAETYTTRAEIGEAVRRSGVKREDIWVTDKYNQGWNESNPATTPSGPYESLTKGLKLTGLKYIDLFLIHGPYFGPKISGITVEEAWKQMEKLVDDGYAKNIGVSNWDTELLEKILKIAKYKPQVNQIEFHAYLQNQSPGIVEFCKKNDILVEGFSPLTPIIPSKITDGGPLDPIIDELTKKYNVTNTQLFLRWVYQNGVLPVTTSSTESRILEVMKIFEFEIDDEDFKKLSNVGKTFQFRGFFKDYYTKFDEELLAKEKASLI